jgi:hypothetical protein
VAGDPENCGGRVGVSVGHQLEAGVVRWCRRVPICCVVPDLLCCHRGLSEEAHHPHWRLWEMGLGSGGNRAMGIKMGGDHDEKWHREEGM